MLGGGTKSDKQTEQGESRWTQVGGMRAMRWTCDLGKDVAILKKNNKRAKIYIRRINHVYLDPALSKRNINEQNNNLRTPILLW